MVLAYDYSHTLFSYKSFYYVFLEETGVVLMRSVLLIEYGVMEAVLLIFNVLFAYFYLQFDL